MKKKAKERNPDQQVLLDKVVWLVGELENVCDHSGFETLILQSAVASVWFRISFSLDITPAQFRQLTEYFLEKYDAYWLRKRDEEKKKSNIKASNLKQEVP